MMTRSSSTVDLRGFAWPLVALERKSQHDVDCAAARTARLLRHHAVAREEVAAREAARDGQLLRLGQEGGAAIDPRLHRQALAYLAREAEGLARDREDCVRIEASLARARLAGGEAQRRRELVRTLRDEAVAKFALSQGRARAKEADLAWLARFASQAIGCRQAP